MIRSFFLFLFLFFSFYLFSQNCPNGQFVIDDNGTTEALSISRTNDGGFILAGHTSLSGSGQEDLFVTKFDSQNNIEWSNTYGTSSSEKGYPIYVTPSPNGYLISLQSTAYAPSIGGLVVINIDLNGNILWQKKIDNSSDYSNSRTVYIDNQGNYLIGGSTNFNTAGQNDAYLIKMSNTGILLWSTTFGTNTNDHTQAIVQTDDNGYLYAGINSLFGTGISSNLLVKVSSSGIYQWSKYYDNDDNDRFINMKIGADNNVYIVGVESFSGNYNPTLTKLDQDGNLIWFKSYDGSGNTYASSIDFLSTGEIYISGYGNSFGNGGNDIFLSKLDELGNEIWTTFYGNIGNESIYSASNLMSLNESEEKIYLIANSNSSGGFDIDPYIVITDLDGNSDCNTVDANWVVTNETPSVGNAIGTIGSMGTMSNSTLAVNPFVTSFDTICSTICNVTDPKLCNYGQYIIDDTGLTNPQSISNTSDGGYILSGHTDYSGAGQKDIFVTKFNNQNIVEWSKTFGTTVNDYAWVTAISNTNNGYLLSFQTGSTPWGELTVINIDFSGNIIWEKKIDDSSGYSTSAYNFQDNNGDYIITGSISTISGFGLDDAYILKMDNLGNVLWSTKFGTNTNDHSFSALQTSDNGYIYGATSRSFGSGNTSAFIVKVDVNGTYLWSKYYDQSTGSAFYEFKIGPDGNIYAVGKELNSGNQDFSITKLDQSGNLIWTKKYSGPNYDHATSIDFLQNGNFYIAGETESFGSGNKDLFISKFDVSGNEIWSKFYGGNLIDNFDRHPVSPLCLDETNEKLYLIGNTTSFGGSDIDPYIIITDLDGNSSCNAIEANWNITNETTTVGNAIGSISSIGSFSNSSLMVNDFIVDLDTICIITCTEDTSNLCLNNSLNDTICVGDSTQINLFSGSNFTWTPDYNISDINTQNPFLYPEVDTTYFVNYLNTDSCLLNDTIYILIDLINCESIDSTQKNIDECIVMPTAFSPNSDNINDILYPISLYDEAEILAFRIYNRWGEEVHNNLSPWDGSYKGKLQALEVYVYYVDFICNGEKQSIFGNVSLIK